MNVFDLDQAMIEEYAGFSRSFTKVRADDIRGQIDAAYATRKYWPEPILQINPHYERKGTVSDLVRDRVLHPGCDVIFSGWSLRTHQVQSVHVARERRSFVVTTGTGSGKSVCFFLPIIDAVLRARQTDERKRTRAIVVYPMNALANSQVGELQGYFKDVAPEHRVTYERYTGQESQAKRRSIAENPPDILLTNFMMLELLLTRQDELDQKVVANCEDLDFLVLDELHTYRGRQGADVAMLVRRLRDRLAPGKDILCVGTSATMTSDGGLEGREVVAEVASKLFATTIYPTDVVIETLERRTDPLESAETVAPRLAVAIAAGIPENVSDAALAANPLAIWAETTLGIEQERDNGPWKRATPRNLSDAADLLATASGADPDACREALKSLLLVASRTERERTGRGSDKPFFGVRLHQFISGAGRAHCTIEPFGVRTVTLDPQRILPDGDDDKRLYAVHFCHNCGQEHFPVWLCNDSGLRTLQARAIDDLPPDEDQDDPDRRFGFFMPIPPEPIEFYGDDTDYPETWTERRNNGEVRVTAAYRKLKHERLHVLPTGEIASSGGVEGWFQPKRFRFCPACGELTLSKGADIYRLAALSAEGRSSATTVLVASILKWMHDPQSGVVDELNRKVLGFTDNRQDAALQAGHFNDVIFVSLLRAAIYTALRNAGPAGLDDGGIGSAIQNALAFRGDVQATLPDWLADPDLDGPLLLEAERTLREVLAHRFWVDQQRGWRVTNPNLERLHLLRAEYRGLDDLAANEAKFDRAHPVLKSASPERRKRAYTVLFDHMRKGLAVDTVSLEPAQLEDVRRRGGLLNAPWNLAEEKARAGAVLLLDRTNRATPAEEEVFRIRGGATSALGRSLRASGIWGQRLRPNDYDQIVRDMLAAAEGLIVIKRSHFFRETVDNWMLYASAIRFHVGDGAPEEGEREPNPYFLDLYRALSVTLEAGRRAILGFEAREHTAQVDSQIRQIREARFRLRDTDRESLRTPETRQKLSEIVDTARFLPVMFCSPTMELGVDIAELDLVYLRNVPPTAANYAQRSGRAGRNGQPALIVTYCAAQSPHDQWFFKRPWDAVKGVVRAPTIDLANQDMIESHLQAAWLAETRTALSARIADVLDLDGAGRPIAVPIAESIGSPAAAQSALPRVKAILSGVYKAHGADMTWIGDLEVYCDRIVMRAPKRFNETFNRWRTLFDSAERTAEDAHARLRRHTLENKERRQLEAIRGNAEKQMELLRGGSEDKQSDFYTYRYLATEGFLPGYNFPRLPLVAFVSTGRGRASGRTTIQRPRFVGISEFGPNSLVYHEGRAHRVRRVILKSGDQRPDNGELVTTHFYICKECGAAHTDPRPDLCHSCRQPLADARTISNAYRIEQVETVPAERITANDEERQRQGFEIRTVYEWPLRDGGRRDIRSADIVDDEGTVATLTFGPAATIRRFNLGLRRRSDQERDGFNIDPRTGYWTRNADDDSDEAPDPDRIAPQPIVPFVEDRKNALLFTPVGELDDVAMANLQYAIARGLEVVFQLQEGEIMGEALPERSERRSILIYEAAEGGAGVLSHLVSDPDALARVVTSAIETCHFDVDRFRADSVLDDVPDAKCVAGCYRCLLSYYNQPDHALVDRRNEAFKTILGRLARTRVERTGSPEPVGGADDPLADPPDPFVAQIIARGLEPPDAKPIEIGGQPYPYVWRAARVVAVPKGLPIRTARLFAEKGLMTIPYDPAVPAAPGTLDALSEALGEIA